MTKEQIALSRRAVASGRWQWAPGALDQFGRRVINVWPDDLGIKWSHLLDNRVVRDADALPDLSDAATLGCLLALVREAWGCAVITSPDYDYDDEEARQGSNVIGWRAVETVRWVSVGAGATEAEALVVALERAP
jgi:hypothetical protein